MSKRSGRKWMNYILSEEGVVCVCVSLFSYISIFMYPNLPICTFRGDKMSIYTTPNPKEDQSGYLQSPG